MEHTAENGAIERAAAALDDLALTLMTTSEDNPEGNALTAGIVQKCAEIVRQHRANPPESANDGTSRYLDILESMDPSPAVQEVIDRLRAEHGRVTPPERTDHG